MSFPLITLTTDFGHDSAYVAAIKGVILSINADVQIMDLTHEIPPQDLRHAAFFLEHALPYFPRDTLHLVVVDPGVGTRRQLLYAQTDSLHLLVPDNGAWTWAVDQDAVSLQVRSLHEPRFWRGAISTTFHGRDVLAPVAAHLSLEVEPEELGPQMFKWEVLEKPSPLCKADEILGEVLFVDHFGNLITNVPGETYDAEAQWISKIVVGSHQVEERVRTYGEAKPGTIVALVSSSGMLEIAKAQGNAAETLQVASGDPVRLLLSRS